MKFNIVKDLSNSFRPYPKNKKEIRIKDKSHTKNVIKKKSSKLAKLERNRFSILTNDLEHCYICKGKKMDIHEVFSGKNRQASMKYGLVIPVCRKCHNLVQKDSTLIAKMHKVGQKVFKKHYKNENFIEIFGENYL